MENAQTRDANGARGFKMKKEDKLFLISFITIILVRISVFVNPVHLIIFGIIIHHFWIGLALMLIGFMYREKIRLLCLGVGVGLMIDEFGFMINGGGSFTEYWSLYSIISVIVLLGIFYLGLQQ